MELEEMAEPDWLAEMFAETDGMHGEEPVDPLDDYAQDNEVPGWVDAYEL